MIMKYLWFGINLDKSLEDSIYKHNGTLFSGHVANNSIYAGFVANGIEADSINCRGVSYFPKYRELFFKRHEWIEHGTAHVNVGYFNGKYSRTVFKRIALTKEASRWAKSNKNESLIILIYSMSSSSIAAAAKIKKKIPNSKIALIVPDLPLYKDLNASKLKMCLKRIDWRMIQTKLPYIDYYFLFSPYMADYLNLQSSCWMTMEGSINSNEIHQYIPHKRKKAIMYAGICGIDFGLGNLLEAFEKIDDEECELWIAGSGNAVSLIKEYAQKDKRIKYYGYLPHERVLELQQSAWAMINLRNPNQEVSRYCFPSKIFEYLLSASPVLSFRIDGIGEEYYKYLIEMKDTSIDGISGSIQEIFSLTDDQREEIGMAGREFVINQKNNVVQAKRMIDFLDSRVQK